MHRQQEYFSEVQSANLQLSTAFALGMLGQCFCYEEITVYELANYVVFEETDAKI